jgi:hypothetical protein
MDCTHPMESLELHEDSMVLIDYDWGHDRDGAGNFCLDSARDSEVYDEDSELVHYFFKCTECAMITRAIAVVPGYESNGPTFRPDPDAWTEPGGLIEPPTRLTIVVEGGIVQGIVADTPEIAAALSARFTFRVRDWDTEGGDAEPGKPYNGWLTQVDVDEYTGKDEE